MARVITEELRQKLREAGKKGGQSRSLRKVIAVRENGKKGGRIPYKYTRTKERP